MTRRGHAWITPILFLLPMFVLLLVIRVGPALFTFGLSLYKWNGFNPAVFVGLKNFADLLSDDRFGASVGNILTYLLTTPVWVLLPLLIAVLISERPFGWRPLRVIMFLPAVMSGAVVGISYGVILRPDGPFDQILKAIGLGGLQINWLIDAPMPTLIVIALWGSTGGGVVIFLAAIALVDRELLDAARVDGANWVQRFRFVTLPQLTPVVGFYSCIVIIGMLSGQFALIKTLTNGGPGFATYVPEFYLYQRGFEEQDYGYASAVALVLFVAIILATIPVLRGLVRRSLDS